jgi:hypothetical protein
MVGKRQVPLLCGALLRTRARGKNAGLLPYAGEIG